MNYISAKAAAEEWGLSVRRVQQYCKDGLIPGAARLDSAWMIPAGTARPQRAAPRHDASAVLRPENLMPLLSSSFAPGEHRACIEAMSDPDRRGIAWAEYYYFSGQAELAVRQAEPYLSHADLALALSAGLICGFASLSLNRISAAQSSLNYVRDSLLRARPDDAQATAVCGLMSAAVSILLHLPLAAPIHVEEVLTALPEGLQGWACYLRAHRVYLDGDYGRSLGVAETALSVQRGLHPISSVYLHLVAAMDLMSLMRPEEAQSHFMAAWSMARPDGLIEAFGEHHGLLQGLIEVCLKRDDPEAYQQVIAITYRFSAGWRKIHNPAVGEEVADDLTTVEFTIAMLASRGWTNQEIARHMELSPHTVKHYISSVYQKLGISSRGQLKKHMLR